MASSNLTSQVAVDHHSLTDWSYAERPDVGPGWYYFAVVYLVCVGAFGLSTNWAIVYAFFKSRTVRGT